MPFAINLVPVGIYIFHQIKKRIKRLSNSINNRKLVKNKIKTLENMRIKGHFKSIGEKMIDELSNQISNEPNQIIFKTSVLNEINNLALKLKDVNINDRKRLLIKLKEVLNYFDTEIEKIENSPKERLTIIGKENELKIAVNKMIIEIQLEINQILKKDLEQSQVKREINQTMNTIDSVMEYTENGHAYQLKKLNN